MGKHGAGGGEMPFGDAEDLKGFKPLSPKLSPEVRDLALTMRGLFQATGRSAHQFAAYHHLSTASISRYLAGERIPQKQFLDVLMKSACKIHGLEVTAELQGHVYQRHREALLAKQPARYREQMASDRLEDAILQREQAELQIHDLRISVSDQKRRMRELEGCIQQIEAASARDRQRLGVELELHRRQKADFEEQYEQLRKTIEDLEAALEEAVRERDAAQSCCAELEAELAAAHELAAREELKRQAREERLRMAKAADVAEQRRADLERVHREAEQVRLAADRDVAAQLEEAEAKAIEIIKEATTKVTKIRPSVMRRPAALRQLRDATLAVAEEQLPELIAQLWRTGLPDVDTRVQPIPINTSDEIGQVARAFDQVHRHAVWLATEHAMLRKTLTTLSRRTQGLIERQLTLLANLENNEADPDQLANLFKLDHLATRMRRNGENLLALAGEEPGRRWNQPVPLVDVLRAASSEVESYERIELSGVPETEIRGRAVTDLVHLLAELLENATAFSSPQTKVRVTATRLPDGRVMIEIHDKGIGLNPEDFADINHKLADPPTVDAAVSQRMGLFVVGRLSVRHGIRVRLLPNEHSGTTALVQLPLDLPVGWSP